MSANVAPVRSSAVSADTLEQVLAVGDLSKLTSAQRVEYLHRVCQSLGLNPLTRPFRFMNFQGQVTLYATKDCADQLRSTRHISISIVDKQMSDDLFMVTARARTPDGREDEDMGVVSLGKLAGEFRANGIMKAITKAKRRVTLSVCGLGFLDELEVETLPGADTFDAERPDPMPEAPKPAPDKAEQVAKAEAILDQPKKKNGWDTWLDKLQEACDKLKTQEDWDELWSRKTIMDAEGRMEGDYLKRLDTMRAAASRRIFPVPPPEAP